jgi:propionate CoA-transferase
MGTFTADKLKTRVENGQLRIINEGTSKKFVKQVEQITFSAKTALDSAQNVLYITERAVFKLTAEGLMLTEIAPGMDIERDILSQMDFLPIVSDDLREMDPRIFRQGLMGIAAP